MSGLKRSPRKGRTANGELRGCYAPSPLVLDRAIAEQTVVIQPLDGRASPMSIDGIAAEVWTALDGRTPVSSIVAELAKRHRVAETRLRRDVQGLIARLARHGLIVRVGA
jgi:hypothetical protein